MPFLGWDPLMVETLCHRARAVRDNVDTFARALRSIDDDDASVMRRLTTEWDTALLPALERARGAAVAHIVHFTLTRWLVGGGAPFLGVPGPNVADREFRQLLANPDDHWSAASLVLLSLDDLSVLFDTAADPALARHLVTRAMPVLDDREAERVLSALIEWYHRYELTHSPLGDGYDPDWRPFLAETAAPYLLHFSPLDDRWHSDAARRAELLKLLIADDVVLRRIIAHTETLTTHRTVALENLAAFLGMLTELMRRRARADESTRMVGWEFAWAMAVVVGGAVGASTSGGLAAGAGAKVGVIALKTVAGQWAPDPARVADDALYAQRWTFTVAAGAALQRLVDEWSIEVPPPPVPSPDDENPAASFLARFAEWRDRLPGGPDGALADRATRVVYTLIAPPDAGAEVVRES